jgi:hypothetical protein
VEEETVEPVHVVTLVLSSLSLIVSVVSVVVALKSVRATRHIAMHTTTYHLHRFADEMCKTNPALLELHGITAADLQKDGVTADEVNYVTASFEAGDAYYQIYERPVVELTEYRKEFLRSPKVRLIYTKYVRGKMISTGPFTQAIDQHIKAVEGASKGGAV